MVRKDECENAHSFVTAQRCDLLNKVTANQYDITTGKKTILQLSIRKTNYCYSVDRDLSSK